MRGAFFGMVAACSIAMGPACGGEFSAGDDPSHGDAGTDGGTDASLGTGGSGVSPATSVTSIGVTSTASAGGAGGTLGVGGAPTDGPLPPIDAAAGGGAGTAKTDASDAASTGQDSPSSGSTGIFCGSASCDPSTQVCCAEIGALDPGSTLPLRCVPKGMCSGTSPMNIPCDDHADCAKSQPTLPICCAGTTSGSSMASFVLFECTTQAGCTTSGSARHEVMCSGANDHDSCPAGKTCRPGLLRDGYFTCQ
jgi:hypothetical protein